MDHTFEIVLWDGTTVGASATLTANEVDLRHIREIIGVHVQFTSVAGAANCRIEYAVSNNGTDFGSSNDNADILDSSANNIDFLTNPEGIHTIASGIAVLPQFIQIEVDELTTTLSDTLVTVSMICKELI